MNFGNASWGFRETPLEEQLKITRYMGLNVLELGIANAENDIPLDADNTDLENVVRLFEKYGIDLLCAATGNDFSNGTKDDVPKLKRVIDICKFLGMKYLRIFAGFSPVEDVIGNRWDTMIECLKEVGVYAEKQKITLTIETHGGVNGFDDGSVEHFLSTSTEPAALCKMMTELPEYIMLNFDPANLWAVGIEHPEEIYLKFKDRIAISHFKDFVTVDGGHIKPAACGDSDMNWERILAAMSDFDGFALFEYENVEDITDGLLRSYNYIKEKLQ